MYESSYLDRIDVSVFANGPGSEAFRGVCEFFSFFFFLRYCEQIVNPHC